MDCQLQNHCNFLLQKCFFRLLAAVKWKHMSSSSRKCNLDIVSSSGPPLFLLCTHNLPFFLSSKWISFVTLLGPSWQAWSFKAADTSIRRGETGTNSAIKIRTNGIAGLWHDFANFFSFFLSSSSTPKNFFVHQFISLLKISTFFPVPSESWWSSTYLSFAEENVKNYISDREKVEKRISETVCIVFLTASKGSKESYCFLIPIAFQHFHYSLLKYTII